MDPGPTISRPYTRHKWVGRMICSQAIVSACAQDPLRLPESMTIIKNRTDNLRFSFPLLSFKGGLDVVAWNNHRCNLAVSLVISGKDIWSLKRNTTSRNWYPLHTTYLQEEQSILLNMNNYSRNCSEMI